MAEVSALPIAMQARRTALETAGKEGVEASTTQLPPADTSTGLPNADKAQVTISREEFNDLQASAQRARAAEGKAESAALDVAALQARLTELETGSKDRGVTVDPAPEPYTAQAVTYTEEDNAQYGDSKPYIVKVVHEVLNEVLPAALKKLQDGIVEVRTLAGSASDTVRRVQSKTFTDRVRERVGNFDECVGHKHWGAFMEGEDENSGYTNAQLIQHNLAVENLNAMVKVFDRFKEKYAVGKTDSTVDGYAAGSASGSGTPPIEQGRPEMLKFSERKLAHKQFIAKEISYEEYEKVKLKFDAAEKENRIDYDN